MINRFSKFLDVASEYLARRKGLLPLAGIGLIILNLLVISILPHDWYIVQSNLLLHLGLVVALFGIILSWAL
jgi:hypothetical protein